MNTRQIAYVGVSVALLAVSAWVTLPIGPVPFTLQTLALAMLPAALDRAGACASVAVYLLLGAIGLPVFSGFSGGIASIFGPTGGFLWGFLIGMLVATTVKDVLPAQMPLFARTLVADAILLLISYASGTFQLMVIGSMDVVAALLVAVVPFVIPDVVKLVVGAQVGCAVARAAGRVSRHA